MAEIFHFVPQHEKSPEENLRHFVAGCKSDLSIFGADLPFDAMVWDVTDACARKGQGNKRERLTFCTFSTVKEKSPTPMAEGFGPFARSYIRYMQGMRPVVGLGPRVAALRALEGALFDVGGRTSPTEVDTNVLNRAAAIIADGFEKSTAYRVAIQLEMIAEFLTTNRLTWTPLAWRSPIKRPVEGTRVGKVFDELRASKMPSEAALDALPKIYRLAEKPQHILVTSIAAILCSSPDRINEVLHLPVDCELTRPMRGDNEEAYGIRWWPSKGADPMVKWIIPSMSGVVREALAKIREATVAARMISQWYEKNPNQLYLSDELEFLRTKPLVSMAEINDMLWGGQAARTTARAWCLENKIPIVKEGRWGLAPFTAVEAAVLAILPSTFPIYESERQTKYSDALFVVQRNLMHSQKATYVCMVEALVIQHVNDGLGSRTEHGARSIFDEFGFVDEFGNSIAVLTHQFRHYLNTLAQAGGLSQLDIAKWSGRKDINQNKVYNHVTADEMVAKIRASVGNENRVIGPLASIPKTNLISRDEFARLKIPTAHTTEFGFCVHDYTMSPCQLHRDCINCEEQVCVKGDEAKEAAISAQLRESRKLLEEARLAVDNGNAGADRWLEHHVATTDRLEHLARILADPHVPVGSLIQLANSNMPSRMGQAEQNRVSSSDAKEPAVDSSSRSVDRLRAFSVKLIR